MQRVGCDGNGTRQLTRERIDQGSGREGSSGKRENGPSNVRFAEDEEIDPLDDSRRNSQIGDGRSEELSPEAHEQIRNLAMTLQKSRLQENRMANFAYETVSMPPSRVRVVLQVSSSQLTRKIGTVEGKRRPRDTTGINTTWPRVRLLSVPIPSLNTTWLERWEE